MWTKFRASGSKNPPSIKPGESLGIVGENQPHEKKKWPYDDESTEYHVQKYSYVVKKPIRTVKVSIRASKPIR